MRGLGTNLCDFCSILILKGIMTFSSQRVHAFFWTKTNFNENQTESKMENPTHSFRETNLVLHSSYKNLKLTL